MRGPANLYRRLGLAVVAALGVHLAFVLLVLLDVPKRPPPSPVISLSLITPDRPRPTAAKTQAARLSPLKTALPPHLATPNATPLLQAAPTGPAPAGSAPSNTASASARAIAALQFGQACQQARRDGKPLPRDCAPSAAGAPLGPRPVPEFEAAAKAINAHRAYQAAPGSPDFWGRTHQTGSPGDRGDGLEKYGLSDGDPGGQRVFGQCGVTSSCTSDGHDPRGPDYHPGFVKWTDPKDQK